MAWRSHGTSNATLISNLRSNGLITTDRVYKAMLNVDRANYVLNKQRAYEDCPQSISYGATISAPHMHAAACETLLDQLKPGAKVLDVGCGSGYLLGIFHELVAPGGTVVGIEHIDQLSDFSRANLKKDGKMHSENECKVVTGDGRLGFPTEAPFDVIHVGAAPPTIPQALIDQLQVNGRMFIPVGPAGAQSIMVVDKDAEGKVTRSKVMDVSYVPLTDKEAQWSPASSPLF